MNLETSDIMGFQRFREIAISICELYELDDQSILFEINKLEIIAAAQRSHELTGYYLTKDLRQRLAKRFHLSDSDIQRIVYSNH